MLLSEFKNKISDMGYILILNPKLIYVDDGEELKLTISTEQCGVINILGECNPELLEVSIEFANTPLVDRHEGMSDNVRHKLTKAVDQIKDLLELTHDVDLEEIYKLIAIGDTVNKKRMEEFMGGKRDLVVETREEYDRAITLFRKLGLKWSTGDSLSELDLWEKWGSGTVLSYVGGLRCLHISTVFGKDTLSIEDFFLSQLDTFIAGKGYIRANTAVEFVRAFEAFRVLDLMINKNEPIEEEYDIDKDYVFIYDNGVIGKDYRHRKLPEKMVRITIDEIISKEGRSSE